VVAHERAGDEASDEAAKQLFRGEAMRSAWAGPNVDNKLRLDLEKAALALARARHATTSAPVMLSMELEYFGFNTYKDPSIHRQGEYNNFIRMIDETRPRRIRKGDGRAR
jgi:hypothetical protein